MARFGHKLGFSRRIPIILTSLFVAGVGIAIITLFAPFHLSSYQYLKLHGGDIVKYKIERFQRLKSIQSAITDFRIATGRLPANLNDFSQVVPAIVLLLSDPLQYTIAPTLVFDFEALKSESLDIVVDDPGWDWPGYPASSGSTPRQMEKYRYVLLNEGRIVYRDDVPLMIEQPDR